MVCALGEKMWLMPYRKYWLFWIWFDLCILVNCLVHQFVMPLVFIKLIGSTDLLNVYLFFSQTINAIILLVTDETLGGSSQISEVIGSFNSFLASIQATIFDDFCH